MTLPRIFFFFRNWENYNRKVNVITFLNTEVSDEMAYANRADADLTAPKEQSDQGLLCLPFH